MVRLVKTLEAFDSLQVLMGSIYASVSVLVWSSLLLVLVQVIVSIFLSSTLEVFISDPEQPLDKRHEVYAYFGTFTRCMITMFELTLANWIPVTRLLFSNVSEWYGLLILAYKLAVG